MLFLTRGLLLIAGIALADLTCKPYIPHQAKSSFGAIQFNEGADVIDYYVLKAANPAYLNSEPDDVSIRNGTIFQFQTCSSQSLKFGPVYDPGKCRNGFQEHVYYNSIRVVNNATGHCMSTRPAKDGQQRTELFFEACNNKPTTTAQIFRTYQTDDGICPRSTPGSVKVPGFLSFEYAPGTYGDPEDLVPSPWVFGDNQRTIEYVPKSQGNGTYLQGVLIMTK